MDNELENMATQSQDLLKTIAPNVWVEAAIIVAAGLMLAKVADLIIVGFISRLLQKTDNKLDDKILRLLHKPLFTTFSILGLMVATFTLSDEIDARAVTVVMSILKTIIIFSWLIFLLRCTGAVLASMVNHPTRFAFAQQDVWVRELPASHTDDNEDNGN